MAILIILLYAAIILDQSNIIALGQLFGYTLYAIIIIGIVAGIWIFIKPTKKRMIEKPLKGTMSPFQTLLKP